MRVQFTPEFFVSVLPQATVGLAMASTWGHLRNATQQKPRTKSNRAALTYKTVVIKGKASHFAHPSYKQIRSCAGGTGWPKDDPALRLPQPRDLVEHST